MLVRYLPGAAGETARVVHVVALPTEEQVGVVGAVCGAALMVHGIEIVTPGVGMPCTVCVVTRATGTAAAGEPAAGPAGRRPGGPDAAGGGRPDPRAPVVAGTAP